MNGGRNPEIALRERVKELTCLYGIARVAAQPGIELIVHRNPEAEALGINPFDHGSQVHTDLWKTQGLKQALDQHGFDAAFGGARRAEEKSRAKESVFSLRNAHHHWNPQEQRPELWRRTAGPGIRPATWGMSTMRTSRALPGWE